MGRVDVRPASARAVVSFASNDYLGLRDHAAVRQAAIHAIERYGVGAAAGRSAAEHTDLHEELERRLAALKGVEAALTFQSGFVANLGTIPMLAGERDLVLYDELSHGSTVDGVRLSGAAAVPYVHRDSDDVERRLRAAREGSARYAGILIATDAVFSFEGDIAPLPALCALAERYDARLLVDDAHATGVLGRGGRGSVDHFGLHGRVTAQVGTLSKAVGVLGGFVATDARLRGHLEQSRPILYSTLLPPALVAAAAAALDVMVAEPERLERLRVNAGRFRSGLQRLGFDTGTSETPIVPVLLPDTERAVLFSERLRENGIGMRVIPGVAARRARLRAIVTAMHSSAEIDECLDVMGRVGRDLGQLR